MAVTSLLGNQLGSQVAVPLAANVLCAATDFRTTYRVMGISALAFGCTALALARERTRDTPPGPVSEQVSEQVSDVRSSATVAEAWTKRRVLRCPAFWAHVLVVFVAFNMVCSLPLSLCLCLCLSVSLSLFLTSIAILYVAQPRSWAGSTTCARWCWRWVWLDLSAALTQPWP